jgi:hypothetical protein
MIHAERDYFEAGYKYERGHPTIVFTIRSMLDKEKPHDRTEARHLIASGRLEASLTRNFKKAA